MCEFNRLPTDVIPTLYDLKISVDLNSKWFEGKLAIEIDVLSSTQSILLNAYKLLIDNAQINENMKSEIVYYEDVQKIALNFNKELPIGKLTLFLDYHGTLNESMKGFYHSSYTTSDGGVENLAVTHFEPTNARYAFPCWDEPAVRAPFKISICAAKGLVAVSNMPVKSVTEQGDTVLTEFETTPSMSTYLVAFAVGNLEQKKLPNTTISVYCRRNTPDNWASFALDVGFRAIEFYNEWFAIEYNLPKLDLFAVPDFAGGAMENWGLVTFRERALLVNEDQTSIGTKKRVALIISHELAHMWFGNLVTLEWWTDLWLKEGFAKWIEYFCVDHCFPNYDIWNQFVVGEYLRTMKLDSMISTHAIEVEVKSPEEISEIFDTISYAKGASVIRMLFDYLGEKQFQAGLRRYLNKFQFKATKTENLWDTLQECTDKPVKEVMNSWTRQAGYPVVTVEIFFSKSGNEIESMKFHQERFLQSGERHSEKTLWNIPITIANGENPREEVLRFVMKDNEMTIDLTKLKTKFRCVYVNPSAIGIYRVIYEKGALNDLKKCLSSSKWSSNDKFGFLEDCFALTNAGKMPYGDVLDMIDFMKQEKSFSIWEMVDSNLEDMHNLLDESTHGVENMNLFIRQLAIGHHQRLGWEESSNDDQNDVLLRPLMIRLLALANDKDVISKAQEIFINYVNKKQKLSANIRGVIFLIVGMNASEEEYNSLSDIFQNCETSNEQAEIISCLGMVPLALQDKFKNWVLSDKVRKQDKLIGLVSAANTSWKHREMIWITMQHHWTELKEMYAGQFLMGSLLKGCLNGFCNNKKAAEIRAFFETNDSTSPRNVDQVIEKIEGNHRRLYLHTDHVHEYLITKNLCI